MDRFTMSAGFPLRKQTFRYWTFVFSETQRQHIYLQKIRFLCKQAFDSIFQSVLPFSKHSPRTADMKKTNLPMAVSELTQEIPHRPDSLIAQCVQMCPGPEYKHFHVNLSAMTETPRKRCYLLLLGITYTTGNKTKRPTSVWKTKRKQFHGEIFVCDNFSYLASRWQQKAKVFLRLPDMWNFRELMPL